MTKGRYRDGAFGGECGSDATMGLPPVKSGESAQLFVPGIRFARAITSSRA
jgi:hypothetical protein